MEEEKIKTDKKFKEEPEIVIPSDLGMGHRFFKCPKCGSEAIAMDKEFEKNNLANSCGEDGMRKLRLVLICTNCNHRDLLDGFIEKSRFTSISPNPSTSLISPDYYQADPGLLNLSKRKKRKFRRITWA